MVIVVLSLTVLCGIAALAIDAGGFRAHRRQLQSAADAGALAGAQKLINHPAQACSSAGYYQRQNDDSTDPKNMIVDGNLDTSFCEILTAPGCSQPCAVRVQPDESNVPYIFGQVLGFVDTSVSARARARIVYLTKSKGLLPFGVEDLRPSSVKLIIDRTGQQIPLAQSGCSAPTAEGYPYWCSAAYVNTLPAGGSTVSVHAVDTTGQAVTWNNIGYLGSDQSISGGDCTGSAVCVKDVTLSPLGDPYLYYTSTSSPKSFTALAHLTNVGSSAVRLSFATGGGPPGNGAFKTASLVSGTTANGTWSASFTSATGEVPAGQDIYVRIGNGGNAPTTAAPAQHAYARDDGDILQQYVQDRHYIDPAAAANSPARFVSFNVAFQVLVKGRIITLKLGGGGAQGNSGNYQGLDLDTNSTWPTYACYANGGDPEHLRRGAARVVHAVCDRRPRRHADRQLCRPGRPRPAESDRDVAEPVEPDEPSARRRPALDEPHPRAAAHLLDLQRHLHDPRGRLRRLLHHGVVGAGGQHPAARRGPRRVLGSPKRNQPVLHQLQRAERHLPRERRSRAVGRIAQTQSEETS